MKETEKNIYGDERNKMREEASKINQAVFTAINTQPEKQTQTLDNCWCLVELFGHQKIVGKVTETSIAGGAFLRVDVPEGAGKPAFTRFFGPGAIYSINPTTESLAREMLLMYRNEPVSRFYLPQIEEKVRPSFTSASESSGPEDGDNDDDGEWAKP